MVKHHPRKDLNFRLSVLNSAEKIGITKTAELFNLTRDTIYRWKKNYAVSGADSLINKSRKEQFHPRRIPDQVRVAIQQLATNEPDLTLQEIITRLNLQCSLNSVSRILKAITNNSQLPSAAQQNESFKHYYLNVEKIPVKSNNLPAYLLQIKELNTGISFYGFASENSPNSAVIFVDYFLTRLSSFISTDQLFFHICKGRFYHARDDSYSLLAKVICKKFGAGIVVSTDKLRLENELLNLMLTHHTANMNHFYQLFYNQVTQNNLTKILQPEDWHYKLLLLPPLLIESHAAHLSEMLTNATYWRPSYDNKILHSLLPDLFSYLLSELDNRVKNERNLSALEAFTQLFALLGISGCQSQDLEAKLLMKFSEALDLCCEWKKAEETVLKILKLTSFQSKSVTADELKALEFVAYINEKNGCFLKAAEFYRKLLNKLKTMPGTEKRVISLLEKTGYCYKMCGEFKRAVDCFKMITAISGTTDYAQNRLLAQKGAAGIYSAKGNYRYANKILRELLPAASKTADLAELAGDLGRNYYYLRNYSQAEIYIAKQLVYLKDQSADNDYFRVQGVMGMIKHRLNKSAEAKICFSEYIDFLIRQAVATRDKLEKIITWAEIASIKKMEKEYDTAIIYLKKSISAARRIDNLTEQAYGCLMLGSVYLETDNLHQALYYTRTVLDLSKEQQEFRVAFYATWNLAQIYFKQRNYAKAKIWYQNVERSAKGSGNTTALADSYKQLGLLDYQSSDFANSISHFQNYLTICGSKHTQDQATVCHHLANALFKSVNDNINPETIEKYYLQAEKIYLKDRLITELAALYFDLSIFYDRSGAAESAKKIRTKAGRWIEKSSMSNPVGSKSNI